jgi:nucleoside-diphosphate-sugar epimerase
LEQAVHPLSQIDDLLGPIRRVDAQPQRPRQAGEGIELITEWLLSLQCERGTAQVQFSLGQTFPVWALTVIGDDGALRADMIHSRVSATRPTPWLDAIDSFSGGWGEAVAILGDSVKAAGAYVVGISGLAGRNDPFFRSMQASIGSFYRALGRGKRPRAELGARLVGVCGDVARRVNGPKAAPRPAAPAPAERFDVALIGGTGFIGRHTLSALQRQGKRVAVFARSTANLPGPFHRNGVGVFQGSIGDADAVADLVSRAPVIVNLAHGGASGSAEVIRQAMVGGAMTVAEAAAAAGCRQVIHVSSIAALYLGGAGTPVTAETPPDPHADRRAAYARAKALAERALLGLHANGDVAICILRPGVVLGQGTSPFHSGIGLFNRETHCIGWNRGDNRLPLVLAEDVAAAIVNAIDNPATVGKTLNLVGDVRLSARDYIQELARASGRPFAYHPQARWLLQAEELAKWAVKRASGRQVPLPSYADLMSRGMPAVFDCQTEKAVLDWRPEADRERFLERAFAGYAA